MTILVDEIYAETERKTIAEAEGQVRDRYAQVYGAEEGERRLRVLFDRMAANIRSDGRRVNFDVSADHELSR